MTKPAAISLLRWRDDRLFLESPGRRALPVDGDDFAELVLKVCDTLGTLERTRASVLLRALFRVGTLHLDTDARWWRGNTGLTLRQRDRAAEALVDAGLAQVNCPHGWGSPKVSPSSSAKRGLREIVLARASA